MPAIIFPNSPAVNDVFTAGSRVWVWNGTAWVADTGVAAAAITSNDIADGSISTAKLASGAITTAKIADDAVTAAKIIASAITTAKINDDAVTAAKLADTAVTAGSYTATNITVDAQGRITAASSTSTDGFATLANSTFTGNIVLPSTTTIGDVSSTELGYLNNVSSAIQTQLDNKQAVVANVSDTEIGYLDGVTSAIQTQLNNKQAVVANVSDTEIGYLDGVTSAIQTQLNNSIDYYITNSGSGAYLVNGVSNGTIHFVKGKRYKIIINASGHPFWIQTVSGAYASGSVYSTGITNGGTDNGTIIVELPQNAPDTLYYACQYHSSMAGSISTITVEPAVVTSLDLKVSKTSLPVSVSDYGAVGDGVTDDTAAFDAAAQARTGNITFDDNGILRAPGVFVTVPDGNYVLSSRVDTGGRDVIWILDRGARILNTENLNGEVLRQGQRIMQSPFGNEDNATGFAVRLYPNGSNFNDAAEVLGVANEADISIYTDRDAVAMFADVYAPAPTLTLTNATYTATTVIPASTISEANRRLLRKGMIIDTAHSPTKYSGFITNWAENGSSITVEGWYLANGTAQSASTPPGTATAYVNPFTKVWAHNANVLMNETSHASAMTGFELGLVDNKEASTAASGGSHYVWGFDAVNLGTYKVQSFFVARGSGFVGLRVDNADTALYYTGGTNVIDAYIAGQRSALIRADGTMELGKQNTAATWTMDLHTSGNAEAVNDYDARIQATGGTTTDGTATVTFFASNTDTQTLRPRTDDEYTLGGPSRRWTIVYATTGTINTSDEREKEQIGDINEAVLRAWGNVEYQQFKFKDAVVKKGDGARWHIGLVAQRVKEAFEAEGVDPFAYGILCYDEWEEQEEKIEEGVGVVQQFEAAGSRYGIRYEEALALECAYLRQRLNSVV